jgi:hypothetical protein
MKIPEVNAAERGGICIWRENDDGNWETECDEIHVFEYGSPHDNNYIFCPYCGMQCEGKWEEKTRNG